ncbi:hypothetical protein HZB01_05720 [Candidatus Woesearchaeota archaeon]|nr:hypothetical protein [Candidatus Woesearchaeota archaeon]
MLRWLRSKVPGPYRLFLGDILNGLKQTENYLPRHQALCDLKHYEPKSTKEARLALQAIVNTLWSTHTHRFNDEILDVVEAFIQILHRNPRWKNETRFMDCVKDLSLTSKYGISRSGFVRLLCMGGDAYKDIAIAVSDALFLDILGGLRQTKDHLPRNSALYDLVFYDPVSVEKACFAFKACIDAIWSTREAFPQRLRSDIFGVNEDFRHILRRHPSWKKNKQFFEMVASFAQDKKYGKERISFIWLLRFGDKKYSPLVLPFLADDRCAQITIKALCGWSDASAADKVRPYLTHPKAHLRNEAKKYFRKIENNSQEEKL